MEAWETEWEQFLRGAKKRLCGGLICSILSSSTPSTSRVCFPTMNVQEWRKEEVESDGSSDEWRTSGLVLRKASYQILLEVTYLTQNELLDYIQDLNTQ